MVRLIKHIKENNYYENFDFSKNYTLEEWQLYLEASAIRKEVEKALDSLGGTYKDRYFIIRDKNQFNSSNLKEYQDFNKLLKKIKENPDDVKLVIDTKLPDEKSNKKDEDRVIASNSDWEVWRVTSYDKAHELMDDSNCGWCIAGYYPSNRDTDEYFYRYIDDWNLDGGYYFFINKDDKNDSLCVLRDTNNNIQVWACPDHRVRDEDLPSNLPNVTGIDFDSYEYSGSDGYDGYYDGQGQEEDMADDEYSFINECIDTIDGYFHDTWNLNHVKGEIEGFTSAYDCGVVDELPHVGESLYENFKYNYPLSKVYERSSIKDYLEKYINILNLFKEFGLKDTDDLFDDLIESMDKGLKEDGVIPTEYEDMFEYLMKNKKEPLCSKEMAYKLLSIDEARPYIDICIKYNDTDGFSKIDVNQAYLYYNKRHIDVSDDIEYLISKGIKMNEKDEKQLLLSVLNKIGLTDTQRELARTLLDKVGLSNDLSKFIILQYMFKDSFVKKNEMEKCFNNIPEDNLKDVRDFLISIILDSKNINQSAVEDVLKIIKKKDLTLHVYTFEINKIPLWLDNLLRKYEIKVES